MIAKSYEWKKCDENPSVNEEVVATGLDYIDEQRDGGQSDNDADDELFDRVFDEEAERLLVEAMALFNHECAVDLHRHAGE